jgi:hypothetical protein
MIQQCIIFLAGIEKTRVVSGHQAFAKTDAI